MFYFSFGKYMKKKNEKLGISNVFRSTIRFSQRQERLPITYYATSKKNLLNSPAGIAVIYVDKLFPKFTNHQKLLNLLSEFDKYCS